MFLFRGDPTHRIDQGVKPQEWRAHLMKWQTWLEALGAQAREIVGGHLLVEAKDITGTESGTNAAGH